jgi:hypothetical protein
MRSKTARVIRRDDRFDFGSFQRTLGKFGFHAIQERGGGGVVTHPKTGRGDTALALLALRAGNMGNEHFTIACQLLVKPA